MTLEGCKATQGLFCALLGVSLSAVHTPSQASNISVQSRGSRKKREDWVSMQVEQGQQGQHGGDESSIRIPSGLFGGMSEESGAESDIDTTSNTDDALE